MGLHKRGVWLAMVLGIWTRAGPAQAADEGSLYSAQKEDLTKPLLDQFTAKTGIKVNLVTGKEDALLARLMSEGRNSPADLLLTSDAGRLHRAQEAGGVAPAGTATLRQ